MRFKIVSDSSSNVFELLEVSYASVPLKITTAEKEYVDNSNLDVLQMLTDLEGYKGRSGSACPNVNDWLSAFGDAEQVFCVTITSGLSGSFNAATIAAQEYQKLHPKRKVFVLDTRSVGPESELMIEKLKELILSGSSFSDIVSQIKRYQKNTRLMFALESMHNLANNGRVSPLVAKVAGILGVRPIGKASEEGTLEMVSKVRGTERMLSTLLEGMQKEGFAGGKVRIHHCQNQTAAEKLKTMLEEQYSELSIQIATTRGLCSFYAERGGLLIGFEVQTKE